MAAAPVLLPPSSPLFPLQQVQADTERRFRGELTPLIALSLSTEAWRPLLLVPPRGAVSRSWFGIWLALSDAAEAH